MNLYIRRKRMADGILWASFLLTILFLVLNGMELYPTQYRRAFDGAGFLSEAMFVASLADYVAVTALTKQILWFQSTGLVPKKREEIIKAVVTGIKEKMLTAEFLLAEINGIPVKERILEFILREDFLGEGDRLLTRAEEKLIEERISLSEYFEKPTKEYLKKLNLRGVTKALPMDEIIQAGDPILLKGIKKLEDKLSTEEFFLLVRNGILSAVEKQKEESLMNRFMFFIGEKSNVFNGDELAEEVCESIRRELGAFREKENGKERQLLAMNLLKGLMNGIESRKFAADLIRLKNKEIDEADVGGILESLIGAGIPLLKSRTKEVFSEKLTRDLSQLVHRNGEFIDREIRGFLSRLILAEYENVMDVSELMLNKLSDKNLVEKVNEIVGGDLQWLRISGSIVGLAAGAFCYIIMEFPGIMVPVTMVGFLILLISKKARKLLVYYSE